MYAARMMRGPYKAQSVTIGVTNTRAQLRNNGYMLEAGGHIPARCIYKAARFIKAFNYMVALTVFKKQYTMYINAPERSKLFLCYVV